MRTLNARFIAVVAALFVWSCTHTTPPPLRGVENPAKPIVLADLENRKPIPGVTDCPDVLLRGRSIERFVDGSGTKEFDVGVIELSDDGHVSDFEQEEKVFKRLHDFAVAGNGAVVVTFVHGWHHGGKVCDNNMACFRRVLKALSEADPRPVFGVYIGWRGESLHGKASVLTFYDRKRTAHHVGHEGGRQVLQRLDAIYRELNATIHNPRTSHPVTMVTAGHSFGGALVYSAVEGALVGEVRKLHGKGSDEAVGKRAVTCGNETIRPIRPGIGDLVVLVNPAFEARRYDQFAADLTTPGVYAPNQLPVLLTVASEADSAVGVAFPAGRSLYCVGLFWRCHGLSDIIGAGHYDPQTTHDLIVEDDSGKEIHPGALVAQEPPPADADTAKRCGLRVEEEHDYATCACEYPLPENLAEALNPPPGSPKMTLAGGAVRTKPGELIALKSRMPGWDPHAPFIVARATGDIISAHSDIYTPRFVTFLTAYIAEFLKAARNIDPDTADNPCSAVASK